MDKNILPLEVTSSLYFLLPYEQKEQRAHGVGVTVMIIWTPEMVYSRKKGQSYPCNRPWSPTVL
jgi:hypothetical protein